MKPKYLRYDTEFRFQLSGSEVSYNKQFALTDILLCYHGKNRNYSKISKEVINNALPSLYGIPIVGEFIYKEGEEDFGTHGGKIIIDSEGIKFEQTTKPYGFVTKEAVENAQWVTITEKDGHTKHEYLQLKGCIVWKERYQEVETILDEKHPQSMEIAIDNAHYTDDHYLEIDEFTFSAACILGTDVEPCFEEACIGRHYEMDSFKQEFQHMLDEYKKYTNSKEGVPQMELKKFVEALSQCKIGDTDRPKYGLLNVTDEKVNVIDLEDYKAYAFDYAITSEAETEELVINFDAKSEMSLAACEKIEADGFSEFDMAGAIHEATENALADYEARIKKEYDEANEELVAQYRALNEQYELAMKELETFRAAAAEQKEQEHKDAIDEVVAEFSKKLGKVADFLIYKARLDYSKSVEEVRKDLTLMAGKSMMNNSSKGTFSYTPVSTTFSNHKNTDMTTSRYGHLLDKYAK